MFTIFGENSPEMAELHGYMANARHNPLAEMTLSEIRSQIPAVEFPPTLPVRKE